MIIRRAEDIRPSEITPYGAYLNRRQLIGEGGELAFHRGGIVDKAMPAENPFGPDRLVFPDGRKPFAGISARQGRKQSVIVDLAHE